MTDATEKNRDSSVAARIAAQLRDAIVAGDLASDERLPGEQELADRYGVSRPTVREALKRLAAQNLIRSRRGPTGGTSQLSGQSTSGFRPRCCANPGGVQRFLRKRGRQPLQAACAFAVQFDGGVAGAVRDENLSPLGTKF